MRNIEAEKRFVNKMFIAAGLGFILGWIALSIGTEMLVLTYWATDLVDFWIWQGVWIIMQAIFISSAARSIKGG